jgi:hypothetical protein
MTTKTEKTVIMEVDIMEVWTHTVRVKLPANASRKRILTAAKKVAAQERDCWNNDYHHTVEDDDTWVIRNRNRKIIKKSGKEYLLSEKFVDTPDKAKQDAALTSLDYKHGEFRKYFTSPYDQYKEHIGKAFTVIRQTQSLKLATDEEEGKDDMYLIKLETGEEIEAFGHEVCVLNYSKCK